ncbi:BgTH12-06431 [Blumeria graminis f. sp. triticale]|uniref:BgtAc-30480 n=3 Tax=Blumeria graminis TaxID=34373 RepID=A0A9X9LAV5_BLUGR|nr:hypothetical protein BGT96224_Ac30480 [Blumeria graminis f. sp. tritici 96224]CAD6500724.1 BgTH12-06431 [Blumeria graminis f. sp. triticale]VCU41003.1 BgtAc-30480 [Blumeria graminis f. sp. tritici]
MPCPLAAHVWIGLSNVRNRYASAAGQNGAFLPEAPRPHIDNDRKRLATTENLQNRLTHASALIIQTDFIISERVFLEDMRVYACEDRAACQGLIFPKTIAEISPTASRTRIMSSGIYHLTMIVLGASEICDGVNVPRTQFLDECYQLELPASRCVADVGPNYHPPEYMHIWDV